ncbi:nuclease-related domain-containing protein [Nocardioides panacisoli]|uniref:NERD domain-containing protein n=1 Tax=Nocardioides panacisoli TaxID=627624 RepID=A0ABP7HRL4_9ACTN
MTGDSARSARKLREKTDGERQTAEALEHLPHGEWDVFHDVRWSGRRYADIDHIVVGPPGVFVISSKSWSGQIAVHNGVVRQSGRRRDAAAIAAVEAAYAVAQLVPDISPTHVHGVLCFGGEHHVTAWSHSPMLCSTRNIATMLASRPPVMMQAAREDVVRQLREQVAKPTPVPPRGAASGSRSRAKQTFIASLVGGAVAAGALVVITHPEIPDKVGDLVVGIIGSDDPPQKHPHGKR